MDFIEDNQKRQFIFCSSTLPMGFKEDLTGWFPDITHVRSPKAMHVPEHIQHSNLKIPADQLDTEFLVDKVKEILQEETKSTILVFCETKRSVDRVC